MHTRTSVLALALVLSLTEAHRSYGQAAPADAAPPAQTSDVSFAQVLGEWNEMAKQIKDLAHEIRTTEDEKKREPLISSYTELVAKSHPKLEQLRMAGVAAYEKSPNDSPEVVRTLLGIMSNDVRDDNYEAADKLAKLLMEKGCDQKALWLLGGKAAFCVCDFENAEKLLKKALDSDVIDVTGNKYLQEIPSLKTKWQAELAIRAAEAKKDDLPRVKMTTSKGDLVIELFENEAPEAVNNFVNLVEKKFYDGKTFHRVIAGFMAQGGCPKGDGTGGPGYHIRCECHKPEARLHFRGSLSMAHAGRDTGGSQFFLTFLPTTHLNGRHTVFGRVVEGFDVLAKLQRLEPNFVRNTKAPDKIEKVEVLRKRDHVYEPTKLAE